MNKKVLLGLGLGLAMTLSGVERSEAWCLFGGCSDTEVKTDIDSNISNVGGSNTGTVTTGDGNTSAANIQDSVVVGGGIRASGSNSIGSIGINKGDISQSNSGGSITNKQTMHDMDMRDFSNKGNR